MHLIKKIIFFSNIIVVPGTVLSGEGENKLILKTMCIKTQEETVRLLNTLKYFKKEIVKPYQENESARNPNSVEFSDWWNTEQLDITKMKAKVIADIVFCFCQMDEKYSYAQLTELLSAKEKNFVFLHHQIPGLVETFQVKLNINTKTCTRIILISKIIDYKQKKELFDWKEKFIWVKWPFLILRKGINFLFEYYYINQFLKAVMLDHTVKHNQILFKSFKRTYKLKGNGTNSYIEEFLSVENFTNEDYIDLIEFFNKQEYFIENLIKNHPEIHFPYCLKICVKKAKDMITENNNSTFFDQCVSKVEDLYDYYKDDNKFESKEKKQKYELFFTALATLFLLYYGGKKLYAHTK